MTEFSISGIRVLGVASAFPEKFRTAQDEAPSFPDTNVDKIAQSIGVTRRHTAHQLTASDLGAAAAARLLSALDWQGDAVDLLVFVTQTADYRLPANACMMQSRLGLASGCAAFDINLGCSGFVYGLAQVGAFLQTLGKGRALLIVADTISRIVSPQDKSALFLFGDGASAIALEHDAAAPPMHFVLGTDGRGSDHLIIPGGGLRNPATGPQRPHDNEAVRRDDQLFMNGAEVFAFALREVPNLVQRTLARAQCSVDALDYTVFHQANSMMLKHLGRQLKIPEAKMLYSLNEYGNTSGASIPITLSLHRDLFTGERMQSLLLVGFGVGFSWGAVTLQIGRLVAPEIVSVQEAPC